ncbi:6-phosphogluconolactonase [Microbacteriaceae bacterium SG_E_30_P1]|uniref:6-phosphogluconolactonase n=1 Tax=Antiquaquibacter oligotrophicus TaxID=2880260 RepID=A0ABT6KMF7_9MICO|nr:6-phosphogluconolactonase [Antiquaquibacter oligotrophicus]MDH6180925.1 6-phosphogluconolactonase [Antiquaquibacter oligotrophicus]UDF13371.1 6-phosphogluconolactonase [Antiquaquibacter oligotrophicus]
MSPERRVLVHADKETLAAAVAARFVRKVRDLIEEFDEATVVLTGGSMGIAALAAINSSPDRDSIDWSRVNVWWGDERWLPKADDERNEKQAREALLDHVPLDPRRVHAFPSSDEGLDLDAAARSYADELVAAAPRNASLPHFDITFLGMGPDGHIASLFPGHPGIRVTEETVIAVRNSPKPPPERLSLTLPVINSSARVWAVVAGSDKASALGLTLADASIDEVPAAGVEGRRRTLFFVDGDAAAEVPENLIDPGQFWTGADE